MFRGLLFVVTILFVTMSASASLAEQRIVGLPQPGLLPYPEIWGWMLPVPAGHVLGPTQRLWITPEGEILAFYSYDPEEQISNPPSTHTQYKAWFRVYNLFRRRLLVDIPIHDPEPRPLSKWRSEIYRSWIGARDFPADWPIHEYDHTLPDGSILRNDWLDVGQCERRFSYLFRWNYVTKTVFWRRMLLRVAREPKINRSGCLAVPLNTHSVNGAIYSLPDGTFLLWETDSQLLLRFRDALESPWVEASDDLILLDTAVVEAMLEEAMHVSGLYGARRDTRDTLIFTDGFLTARLRTLLKARSAKTGAN